MVNTFLRLTDGGCRWSRNHQLYQRKYFRPLLERGCPQCYETPRKLQRETESQKILGHVQRGLDPVSYSSTEFGFNEGSQG